MPLISVHLALVQKYTPLAEAAQTQGEMNVSSKWFFVIWDTELNNIWSRFTDLADQQIKDKVLAEQRNWIAMKEEVTLLSIGSSEENGSMYPLLQNAFLEKITNGSHNTEAHFLVITAHFADTSTVIALFQKFHVNSSVALVTSGAGVVLFSGHPQTASDAFLHDFGLGHVSLQEIVDIHPAYISRCSVNMGDHGSPDMVPPDFHFSTVSGGLCHQFKQFCGLLIGTLFFCVAVPAGIFNHCLVPHSA